jgi:hypothetical protein
MYFFHKKHTKLFFLEHRVRIITTKNFVFATKKYKNKKQRLNVGE